MAFRKFLLAIVVFIPVLLVKFKDMSGNFNPEEKVVLEGGEDGLTDEEIEELKQRKEALDLTLVKNNIKQDTEKNIHTKKRDRVSPPSRGIVKRVPKSGTSMKSYMDYRAITNKASKQYKLQQRSDIYTDNEGFRRIGDKFVIAIGTYFKCDVGQEVRVELTSGEIFEAYIGDIKADKDTDSQNISHRVDGSVIEFLVDSKKLDKTIRKMGDCSFSNINNFKGDVVSIEILDSDK